MFKRTKSEPLRGSGLGGSRKALSEDGSNIRLLIIAAAFLVVTIGLIFLQPDETTVPQQIAIIDDMQSEADVTRAVTSLLVAPEPTPIAEPVAKRPMPELLDISSAQAVSEQLRAPLRLMETNAAVRTERGLTEHVLESLGYQPQQDDPFVRLLVQALTENQSDAYFDALVNTAYVRGEIVPPEALLTVTGRVDVPSLLQTMVMVAQDFEPTDWPASDVDYDHDLGRDDSLVGLALRYYRQPQQFQRISQANGVLSLARTHGPGDVLSIPGL